MVVIDGKENNVSYIIPQALVFKFSSQNKTNIFPDEYLIG